MQLLVANAGRTVAVEVSPEDSVARVAALTGAATGVPGALLRLSHGGRELPLSRLVGSTALVAGACVSASLRLVGGGGDQPDWTELGKMPSMGSKKRGPDSRAPDWHQDPKKYAAKVEKDLRDRGELVVAVGPFCVPCGKRFAKQSVFDAHLSGQKHLRALQRMGKHEEAMVCQLDVEAKRRKIAEVEAAKEAERRGARMQLQAPPTAAELEAQAERKAKREEQLRARDMLPMPDTVAAGSVYEDGSGSVDAAAEGGAEAEGDGAGPSSAGGRKLTMMAPVEVPVHQLAAAGSGASASYTSGMQDANALIASRTNKHTTEGLASSHRALMPQNDWFNPKPAAEVGEAPEGTAGPQPKAA